MTCTVLHNVLISENFDVYNRSLEQFAIHLPVKHRAICTQSFKPIHQDFIKNRLELIKIFSSKFCVIR